MESKDDGPFSPVMLEKRTPIPADHDHVVVYLSSHEVVDYDVLEDQQKPCKCSCVSFREGFVNCPHVMVVQHQLNGAEQY